MSFSSVLGKCQRQYALTQFAFALLALLAYKQGIIWQIVLIVFFVAISLVIYKFIKRIKPRLRLV